MCFKETHSDGASKMAEVLHYKVALGSKFGFADLKEQIGLRNNGFSSRKFH